MRPLQQSAGRHRPSGSTWSAVCSATWWPSRRGGCGPETAQARIDAIEVRLAAIDGEEAQLAATANPDNWGPADLDFASALLGVALDAILTKAVAPERSKALLAQLIEEVRVVSASDVRATYRVPPEVRLMEWWR